MALNTQPNLFEPGKRYFRAFSPGDDFYEALIETHRDLGDEQNREYPTGQLDVAVAEVRDHREPGQCPHRPAADEMDAQAAMDAAKAEIDTALAGF